MLCFAPMPNREGERGRGAGVVLALGALLAPSVAQAFTVQSPVTDACHEQITEAALGGVRAMGEGPSIAADANDQALIDDLPFDVEPDMRELAAVTLLIGNRDNDLKGRLPTELDQLALVHGDPAKQEEHCLRAPSDDEPTGSSTALTRCRAFIRARAIEALAGLDARSVPDPSVRVDLDVSLSLRGRVTASLPLFWVRIGQAMHALQDSFSHTYRTSSGTQVTVDLNWVDYVDGTLDVSRDGPPHLLPLDECNAGDGLRDRNKALAIEASGDLLLAVLDPTTTSAEKATAIDTVLDAYLGYSPGCTFGNAWCDAPENAYSNPSCGCEAAGAAQGGGLALLGLAATLAALRARRRRRGRGARAVGLVAGAALGVTALPARAAPEEAPPPEAPPTTTAAPPTITPRTNAEVKSAVKEQEHGSPIALVAGVAGSFDDVAVAGAVGAHVRVNDRFIVGVEGELNGWYGVNSRRCVLGDVNVYATGILRFPLKYEPINLRTTLQAGAAIEVVNLYGVPPGSVGPFLGVYPLGLEWKASGHVFLVANPLGFALPDAAPPRHAVHLPAVPVAGRARGLAVSARVHGGRAPAAARCSATRP